MSIESGGLKFECERAKTFHVQKTSMLKLCNLPKIDPISGLYFLKVGLFNSPVAHDKPLFCYYLAFPG